jgi:hypothetical protein
LYAGFFYGRCGGTQTRLLDNPRGLDPLAMQLILLLKFLKLKVFEASQLIKVVISRAGANPAAAHKTFNGDLWETSADGLKSIGLFGLKLLPENLTI